MDYQICDLAPADLGAAVQLLEALRPLPDSAPMEIAQFISCLVYTSDAADELTRVDYGGFRILQHI